MRKVADEEGCCRRERARKRDVRDPEKKKNRCMINDKVRYVESDDDLRVWKLPK